MPNSRTYFFCLSLISGATAAEELPMPSLVSPGVGAREARLATSCPTFSWTPVRAAKGYSLAIYALPDDRTRALEPDSELLLRIELPAGATSWTPGLDECLPGAGRYGWTVGARSAEAEPRWSPPGLFRVIADREPPVGRTPDPETAISPSTIWQVSPPEPRPEPMKPSNMRSVTSEAFAPPACSGTFTDVVGNPYCGWIEQLYLDKITTGCGPSKYCPDHPVTRAQMAAYLGRAMHGTDTWQPAAGGGADVQPPAQNGGTGLDTAGDVGQYTSITIGADGLGLISYHDVTNGDLKVAHCSNIECSSATITMLDPGPNAGKHTSIAIGPDGLGVISYYAAGDLKLARCSNVACTAATLVTLDPGAEDAGLFSSIHIVYPGVVRVAQYDVTNGWLKFNRCLNAACTSSTTEGAPADLMNTGSSPLAAVGGSVHSTVVAFLTDTGFLQLGVCNSDCGSLTQYLVFPYAPETGTVNGDLAVVVGADGKPLIAYRESGGLQVSHCAEHDVCVGYNSVETSYGGTSAEQISMAVGTDGMALMTATGIGLHVVHCENVECTYATRHVLFGIDAQFSSVTIGADGLPLISFYDSGQHDLRVVHCANLRCAPFFRRR
jgi:hypothetical protein